MFLCEVEVCPSEVECWENSEGIFLGWDGTKGGRVLPSPEGLYWYPQTTLFLRWPLYTRTFDPFPASTLWTLLGPRRLGPRLRVRSDLTDARLVGCHPGFYRTGVPDVKRVSDMRQHDDFRVINLVVGPSTASPSSLKWPTGPSPVTFVLPPFTVDTRDKYLVSEMFRYRFNWECSWVLCLNENTDKMSLLFCFEFPTIHCRVVESIHRSDPRFRIRPDLHNGTRERTTLEGLKNKTREENV